MNTSGPTNEGIVGQPAGSPPNEASVSNTGSISGAEIESQPAVWGKAQLERDRPALGETDADIAS